MRRIAILGLLAGCLMASSALEARQSEVNGRQSYESCGLISGEYLTVLQLLARGIAPETLKQTLPDISDNARKRMDALVAMAEGDGLIESYSTINSEYAACAKQVYRDQGIPTPGSREAHFYRCAGENKVGYEIALAAIVGASRTEVASQLLPEHQEMAAKVFQDLDSGGALAVFDGLATGLKRCLAMIP